MYILNDEFFLILHLFFFQSILLSYHTRVLFSDLIVFLEVAISCRFIIFQLFTLIS